MTDQEQEAVREAAELDYARWLLALYDTRREWWGDAGAGQVVRGALAERIEAATTRLSHSG
jgi:hypothetical protein